MRATSPSGPAPGADDPAADRRRFRRHDHRAGHARRHLPAPGAWRLRAGRGSICAPAGSRCASASAVSSSRSAATTTRSSPGPSTAPVCAAGSPTSCARPRPSGHRVVVVSSGFKSVIRPVLEREGVGHLELLAHEVRFGPDGSEVMFRSATRATSAARSASGPSSARWTATGRRSTSATAGPTAARRSTRSGCSPAAASRGSSIAAASPTSRSTTSSRSARHLGCNNDCVPGSVPGTSMRRRAGRAVRAGAWLGAWLARVQQRGLTPLLRYALPLSSRRKAG